MVGVGPGNGAALGRRFAREGYAVALLARTTATSEPLAASLADARSYSCDVTDAAFEGAFRVNALGLLLAAKQVVPAMKRQGGGNIVVIGATSSRRGVARTAAFAPAKAAQKSLAESMARHLWPQNIHVSLIIVDGVVDLPRTRAVMKDKPDDFFIAPDDLADTAFHLTTQPRSAWSFEVEARPFRENW